jgi:hypothetical protein
MSLHQQVLPQSPVGERNWKRLEPCCRLKTTEYA